MRVVVVLDKAGDVNGQWSAIQGEAMAMAMAMAKK